MKKTNIKILTLLVLMTLALSSCLKDLEDYMGAFEGVPATAEILNRPSPATGLMTIGFVDPTKKIDVTVKVSISRSTPMNKDTKVTLALDNALITAYNTKKGLTGEEAGIPVPAAGLIIPSLDVTIPANQYDADFKFQVDPLKLVNAAALNIIPLKISSADNGVQTSGNFGVLLVQIIGRNTWDGIYTVTGTLVDAASGSITGNYPMTIHLVTSGATVCRVDEPAAAPWGNPPCFHTIRSGTSLSVYGSFGLIIKFNGTTNAVTSVVNYYGQPASNTRSAELNPAGANVYNPTAKTVTIKYWMKQPSVITDPPNIRTTFDEVWTYTGPRPE